MLPYARTQPYKQKIEATKAKTSLIDMLNFRSTLLFSVIVVVLVVGVTFVTVVLVSVFLDEYFITCVPIFIGTHVFSEVIYFLI